MEAAPAINIANAGSTVPVKFTLEGPLTGVDSQAVDCTTLVPTGDARTVLATRAAPG